jgi:Domain of unknown function (DUF5348)
MTDKESILRMQPSGRWAVCRPGHAPVEITSGEAFRVEDPSKEGLQRTRMEHDAEGYYSVHGHHLHDGLRAAVGEAG